MAGYVFAIGNDVDPVSAIKKCAETGIYSTFISSNVPNPFEGTLADYMSMKPGDNIYFFCKRKYYGVGKLVSVGLDCKYCNYPESTALRRFSYDEICDNLLVDFGLQSPQYRWLCTFTGDPYFFEEGIDTDDILTYKPETFKMLRAFWKVSFIKLGDVENASLYEIFMLRHQKELRTHTATFRVCEEVHQRIACLDLKKHLITPESLLLSANDGIRVKHEMELEAVVVFDLSNDRVPILGTWDYVSHQVIASPFKPIDYMDKIDVFAYRYLSGTHIPAKYLVAELKRGTAPLETIDQILKYVDWVCKEYAYGDYDAVEACVIASDYPDGVDGYFASVSQRFYTLGSHPVRNKRWNALKLLKYVYENNSISYSDVTPSLVRD